MTPRMKEQYASEVAPGLQEQFGITNDLAIPKLLKIVLTVGLGHQIEGTKLDPVAKEQVLKDLSVITGQRAVVTRAKKSVSNFKVRRGYEDGAMVTLRGAHMWEFFDRLVSMAIPRIRDFRGLKSTSFDGQGNYSFGLTEQAVFPEVNMAEAKFMHGMNITFVVKNSDPVKSRAFFQQMGMPFVSPDAA
jgi:large subunit ribosomal protein L5